jgi:hypothetical protein
MPRKARDLRHQLTSKFGFGAAQGRATDHAYFQLTVPGVPRVVTKLSHGKAEVRDDILALMAKQLHVTGPGFAEMMDCTMGLDAYRTHLVEWARAQGVYRPPTR